MTARSFLGAGDVYLNRIVAGVKQGLVGPIYADKFEIKPNVDTKQSTSKGRYDYGQVLETVQLAQPADFTMDLKEVVGDILVMALLGTSSALNQTSGTMTALPITVKLGKWVPIGKKNISPTGITVTHTSGTPTYVEGTDYKLNRPLGLLQAITAGAILDAASVKVNGPYLAATGTVISGATQTDVRCEIVFDGINQADGSQVTVTVREAVIAADSAFDFLADDFNNVSLKGTLKTPAGSNEPFLVELQTAA